MTVGVKFNLPFSLGLADSPPQDMDPKLRGTYVLMYNAFQQLQIAMHQFGGIGQQLQEQWSDLPYHQSLHQNSPNRLYVQASEIITYGQAISIFNDAGVLKVRLANATNNTRPCHGFCTTLAGIAVGEYGEVILNFGLLTGVVGLTLGTRYFLSTTNGLITSVGPAAAGNIQQALGIAVDSTALLFNFGFHFIQF